MTAPTRTEGAAAGTRTPRSAASAPGRDPEQRSVGGAPITALLAALAVLASSAPLDRLVTEDAWRSGALLQVGVVAVLGIALRLVGLGPGRVAFAQLSAIVITQSVLFPGPNPLAGGLVPTAATLQGWRSLGGDAVERIASNAAPVPGSDGMAFVVIAFVAVVAWAVDVVAVSSAMPAVAALPLLTPLLTALANAPTPLGAPALALPLALWGAMLAERERGWPAGGRPAASAPARRFASAASALALAIAAGLGAAGSVPHLPAHYLADGLSSGHFGRPDRVGFSPDADMLVDLRDSDPTPVLVYRSDDAALPPLRVSVATRYADGAWRADPVDVEPSSAPQLPYPTGLRSGVPRTEPTLHVERTELAAPFLASPTPVVSGTVVGARWAVEETTGVPVVDRIPRSYDLRYLSLEPTAAQLHAAERIRRSAFAEELAVPSSVDTDLLRSSTAQAVGGARTPYEKAVEIQAWLRAQGGFTYSLELAPPPAGMSDREAADSAVDRFLTSKRGYCVQFTTAMVMMARTEGIPARVATGFLPGVARGEAREVRASDAHAWPELYFPGVGWLRFEPTPAGRSGAAPTYTGEAPAQDPTGAPTPTPTPTTGQTDSRPEPPPPVEAEAGPDADDGGEAGGAGPRWLPALPIALLVGLAAALTPLAARGSLAARRRRARSVAERAEVEWSALRDGLEDLGIPIPVAATPRDLAMRLAEAATLDAQGREALGRILGAVEKARYARPADHPPDARVDVDDTLPADARTVLSVASSLRSLPTRARAALLPRAGLRALRLPIPDALQPRPAPERRRHVGHAGAPYPPTR